MHICGFALALVFASSILAQGGPPFRSDDPGTPGTGHWEINMAGIGERNPMQGMYSVPNFDFNYGLGDRIQLKYEMAFGLRETSRTPRQLLAGVGDSLVGVKYRFYEHRHTGTENTNFALSVYPQLVFSSVDTSTQRGISDPAQVYVPIEGSTRIRGVLVSGEFGYWFPRKQVPGTWVQAAVVGHEICRGSELFVEIYHEMQQTTALASRHDLTLGVGGRRDLAKDGSTRLLGMLGHSLLSPDPNGARPQWIAYVGVQFLIGGNRN